MLASVIRLVRDIELAEDLMQDAFAVALVRWPIDGVPEKPAAWITTTARRKAIDRLRRDRSFAQKQHLLRFESELMTNGREEDGDHALPAR